MASSRELLIKWVVLAMALGIGLVLGELSCQLILNPADYLSAKTIPDDILGIRITPNSSGFDEWGFRNARVPPHAEIVAIGDSHTYGNTAAMEDAWPSVVARVTGRDVHNLGLGGYGPNQYYYILKTKGLRLHPKLVMCGLYMGDDFENAFLITYGLEYWSSLRKEEWRNVDADIWNLAEKPVWGAYLRNWLSEHSIVYRLVFHGPLLASLKETFRFWQASGGEDPYTTTVVVDSQNLREAFRPVGIAEKLDQSSGQVREGMRITFQLLREMDSLCKQEGCKLLVVLIPTKETVFADYLENNSKIHLHEILDRVIKNERVARSALVKFLDSSGIAYLDTLPALKESVGNHLYAQTTRDMHPGKNGYKVIGEAVAGYLKGQR